MRIDCPACAAAYDVPASVVAAPRTLRCARCGTDFVAPPSPAPALPTPALPKSALPAPALHASAAPGSEPPPAQAAVPQGVANPPAMRAADTERLAHSDMAEAEAPPAGGGRVAAVLAAWALSLALLAGGAWAGVARRDAVMRSFPASNRLYAALGYVR